ncbi:MAG TPA: NAD(P)-binding protein [Acidobacteriaceae bacterium]|jgi:NADPH-dependent glutamate synthase beta subunit-like oxidoreductase
MSDPKFHVIIIGGGVGGLCLAQGLRKNGVSAAVYERDQTPDARLQGYCLNIEPKVRLPKCFFAHAGALHRFGMPSSASRAPPIPQFRSRK